MDLTFAVLASVAGVAIVLGILAATHPVLARLAVRNAVRRRSRVLLVTFGLLIGTAIISSSLTVGDTLEYIFTGDVYDHLGDVDATVSHTVGDQLFSFPESYFATLRAEATARGAAFDGMAPALLKAMPVRNNETGNQAISVMGLDDAYEGGFGPLYGPDGTLGLADLPPDSVYVNEGAARDLDARPGDTLTLFWGNTAEEVHYVRVVAVLRDQGKARWDHRSIVFAPLADAQSWFNATGKIDLIRVSAPGPAIGGEQRSAPLADELRRIVGTQGWNVEVREVKRDGLASAREISDQATELFLVMGSFAIFAGNLLIVNVFVMLAEERKAEMGVSRAVGLKRFHLTLTFLLEGALYVALAAFTGALAGVALGWLMIQVFNLVFPSAVLEPLAFHAEPASVVLAFGAGVLLTIGAVVLTSALVSRLNIVRAIRNLPEPPAGHLTWVQRWFVLLALAGGIAFSIRGFGLLRLDLPAVDLLAIPVAAGLVLLLGLVGFLAARLAERDRVAKVTRFAMQGALAALVLVAAYDALAMGLTAAESPGAYRVASVPLLALGLATVAARRGRARLPFTAAGLAMLYWLLVQPFDLVDEVRDDIAVLFVETGVLLVLGAVVVVVLNTSPLLRASLNRFARRGRPVLRAAVTYPMAKPFRTAMTLAMFALTIFSITVIAMVQGMQGASIEAYISGQSGGYEVAAYTQGFRPIGNLTQELPAHNISLDNFLNGSEGIATATVLSVQMNKSGDADRRDYTLWGVDNFLIERNTYGFLSFLPRITYVADNSSRVFEIGGREDVWRALRLNRSYAVVDRGAAGGDQFTPDFGQLRLNLGDRVWATDGLSNSTREFVVLGILEQSLQFTRGVFVDRETVLQAYPANVTRTAYFFQLAPGVDVSRLRADLEREFFEYGLITVDIREEITTQFEAAQRVLLLMQAYLAIGLLVGVTGLGVITVRAVVERRQEIGAMRALGFTRRMVRWVFLLEIALIASLGIAVGMGLGVFLAWKVYDQYFASIAVFTIPWLHLAAVAVISVAFALVATAGPAVRASKLPPAETLRYVG